MTNKLIYSRGSPLLTVWGQKFVHYWMKFVTFWDKKGLDMKVLYMCIYVSCGRLN